MKDQWTLLFDWDGTLVDSLEIKIRNAAQLFHQEAGFPLDEVEASYRRNSGIPRHQLFDVICTDQGAPPLDADRFIQMSRQFSALNQSAFFTADSDVLLFVDTLEALETLKQQDYAMFVSSAADGNEIRQLADAIGIASYFLEIIGSTGGIEKGPQHVEYVMERQGAARSRICMIGDEPRDIYLARKAGVRTIVKAGTYSASALERENPDQVIKSLRELPAILNSKIE